MLCSICKNHQADTTIKVAINGKAAYFGICSDCLIKMNLKNTPDIDSIFQNNANLDYSLMKCPGCGKELNDIIDEGRFGCSKCYTHFKKVLPKFIKKTAGSDKHIGKRPVKFSNTPDTNPTEETLKKLREDLKLHIENENYEAAALIRDKIKELEGK